MAYIQARYRKNGEFLHYRLFVSDGLDWTGKQRRRYNIWTPDKPGMSQKQIEKAALAAAIKFEEEIRAGYEIDKRK